MGVGGGVGGGEEVIFKISQTKMEWLWKSAGLTPEINI